MTLLLTIQNWLNSLSDFWLTVIVVVAMMIGAYFIMMIKNWFKSR